MEVIDFREARKKIKDRRFNERKIISGLKLMHMPNHELFEEYKVYRNTLQDNMLCDEKNIDPELLIYLCEVISEVILRGLLEDYEKRFNIITDIIG